MAGNRLKPIINEKILENSCFIQEAFWGFGTKEKLINKNLLQDLEEINENMEEYNLQKETKEIKLLEDKMKDSFNEITKLRSTEFWLSTIDGFNYENIHENTIFKDLIEAEKICGNFECIAPKAIKVGKIIDETIRNINNCNKRESLEMKYFQESYKLG